MTDILLLLVGAILVNNFMLMQLLGTSPLMSGSGRLDLAISMAAITTFVLTLSSLGNWLLYHFLLLPLALQFLHTPCYILVIAVVTSATGMVLYKTAPRRYRLPSSWLPLIMINCAGLGVALINNNGANGFIESLFYSAGAAIGFSLVITVFSALWERLAVSDVPEPFRGSSIALITAGLMSLAFMGFVGLV